MSFVSVAVTWVHSNYASRTLLNFPIISCTLKNIRATFIAKSRNLWMCDNLFLRSNYHFYKKNCGEFGFCLNADPDLSFFYHTLKQTGTYLQQEVKKTFLKSFKCVLYLKTNISDNFFAANSEPGARAGIFKLLRNPGISSKESIPPAYVACAGIFKQSMGARNRVGIGLSYRLARLLSLAELVPWNRFLGSLKVFQLCETP
jgi:hypothetical protein